MALAEIDGTHHLGEHTQTTSARVQELLQGIEHGLVIPAYEPKLPIFKDGGAVHFSTSTPASYEQLSDRIVRDKDTNRCRVEPPAEWIPDVFSPAGFREGVPAALTKANFDMSKRAHDRTGLLVWSNLHPRLLTDPGFNRYLHANDMTGVGLELLEGSELSDSPRASAMLRVLYDRGVQISIDDYPLAGEHGNYAWANTRKLQRALGDRQIDEIKIASQVALTVTHDPERFECQMATAIGDAARYEPRAITIEGVWHGGNIQALQEDIAPNYPHIDFNVQSRDFNPAGPTQRVRLHELPARSAA